jgi:hypothetical protein
LPPFESSGGGNGSGNGSGSGGGSGGGGKGGGPVDPAIVAQRGGGGGGSHPPHLQSRVEDMRISGGVGHQTQQSRNGSWIDKGNGGRPR